MVRNPWLRLTVAVIAVVVITCCVSALVIGSAGATETGAGATQPPSVGDRSTEALNGCEDPGSASPGRLLSLVVDR